MHQTFVDTSVLAGVGYEYKMVVEYQGGNPKPAYGYIYSGIRLPAAENRGRLILVIDNTKTSALASELDRFSRDLAGDGWTVVRTEVSPAASPSSVRAQIRQIYEQSPATTRGLILFGAIPVPYSGYFMPDGHPETRNAWPADVFYADMDGIWTDTSVNQPGKNVPGDGRFDHDSIATLGNGAAELQTGRIDMRDMPAWNESETELLRRYLDRNHAFRHRLGGMSAVPRKALLKDYSFGYFNGEAFASTGWRAFPAMFGDAPDAIVDAPLFPEIETNGYLAAYACGGGTSTSMDVVTSADFASRDSRVVFNFFFGSGSFNWNSPNNFLRAPLAGRAGSWGLASCWANRPYWYLHHMAMGLPIGHSARLAQSHGNDPGTGYYFASEFNAPAIYVPKGVHVALMGDPGLRLHPMFPPGMLQASLSGNGVNLEWNSSQETSLLGYRVYRAESETGPYQRIVSTGATSFHDAAPQPGAVNYYMVRAEKLETTGSGTYLKLSHGVFSNVSVPGSPPPPGLPDLTHNSGSVWNVSPTQVTAGGRVSFMTGIANPGTASSGPFAVRLSLSTEAAAGNGAVHLGDISVESIPAGGSVLFQADNLLVPVSTPPGLYYFIWQIDAAGAVTESNEANNDYHTVERIAVHAAGAALRMDGASFRIHGKSIKRRPVRMSGRLKKMGRGRYVKGTLRADAIVNTALTGSGPLSIELSGVRTYGGTFGKVKFTRAIHPVAAQSRHTGVRNKGRMRHFNKRLYPQITLWEQTATGWQIRQTQRFGSRRRL